MQYFIKCQDYKNKCSWEYTQLTPSKQTIKLAVEMYKLSKEYSSSCKGYGHQSVCFIAKT